jgi:hypothetical protein
MSLPPEAGVFSEDSTADRGRGRRDADLLVDNPDGGDHETFALKGDRRARERSRSSARADSRADPFATSSGRRFVANWKR